MGDVEYSTVVPDAVAFRDYALEPDGEVETSILDNVTVLPVILIDVGSSCQDRRLASSVLVEKRMRSSYGPGTGVSGIIFRFSVSNPSFLPHLGQ